MNIEKYIDAYARKRNFGSIKAETVRNLFGCGKKEGSELPQYALKQQDS